MITKQTRVAVLFRRLGPYHHARLNAAGKLTEIFGVEACGMDDTYAWEKVAGAVSFTRMTLMDGYAHSRSWRKKLHCQMWRALHQTKPQVVVVPGWSFTDALSALSWCLETNTPVVMMSESTEWDERRVPWKEWIKRRLVHICSAALVGGATHADYLKKLGLPPERVFLGYDAVDNRYFATKTKKARSQKSEVRSQNGLPDRYFLASARFVEKKNLSRLIEAYARYRELATKVDDRQRDNKATRPKDGSQKSVVSGPVVPWSLVLLGDGPLKSDLCHLISDLGLQRSVLLPGFKQYAELPVYYGLASAFVHASTTEQWGLVVNEAMASGLPVLVSNRCGCSPDLVKNGVNGFTFDPYNVEQLASLMLKISAFNFPLSDFGLASARIISNWGPEQFASGLQQAVETALRLPPPRPSLVDRLLLRMLLMR